MGLILSESRLLPEHATATSIAGPQEAGTMEPVCRLAGDASRCEDLRRRLISWSDDLLRRLQGVQEFSTRPDCLLRIAIRRTTADIQLVDGSHLGRGAQIIELHLWNEHLPCPSLQQGSLSHATRLRRQLDVSLRELARYMEAQPSLRDARAVRAHTALVPQRRARKLLHVAQAFGFWTAVPEQAAPRPVKLRQFCENLFVCALAWRFNPAALRRNGLFRHHCELWISRQALMAGYGRRAASQRQTAGSAKMGSSVNDQSPSSLLRVREIQRAGSSAAVQCAAVAGRSTPAMGRFNG